MLIYYISFLERIYQKDAKQYNELLEDEDKNYKEHDFTQRYKENLSGVLGMIKQKYKYLHLRTYEMTFDDVHYNKVPEKYQSDYSLFIFSIFNHENERCLKIRKEGITHTTYDKNSDCPSTTYILFPYKDLKFNTTEEQIIKNTLNNIENDIKYYVNNV